jgi:hypothetical protein
MLIDATTFDIVGIRYPIGLAPNAPRATEWYSDYRNVSGIRVAFHARVEREGLVIDRAVTSVRLNAPLPSSAFIRKIA